MGNLCLGRAGRVAPLSSSANSGNGGDLSAQAVGILPHQGENSSADKTLLQDQSSTSKPPTLSGKKGDQQAPSSEIDQSSSTRASGGNSARTARFELPDDDDDNSGGTSNRMAGVGFATASMRLRRSLSGAVSLIGSPQRKKRAGKKIVGYNGDDALPDVLEEGAPDIDGVTTGEEAKSRNQDEGAPGGTSGEEPKSRNQDGEGGMSREEPKSRNQDGEGGMSKSSPTSRDASPSCGVSSSGLSSGPSSKERTGAASSEKKSSSKGKERGRTGTSGVTSPLSPTSHQVNLQSGGSTSSSSLTREDVKVLRKALQRHFLFSSLDEDEQKSLVKRMRRMPKKVGELVFRQGDTGDSLYVVGSGTLSVEIDKRAVKNLGRGAIFGELAFLYNVDRTASVRVSETAVLWRLDAATVHHTLRQLTAKSHAQILKFLTSDPTFGALSVEEREALAGVCTIQDYNAGDTILREGEASEWMFLIMSGKVLTRDAAGQYNTARQHDFLGSVYNRQQITSAKAPEKVKLLSFGRRNLERLYGVVGVEAVLKRALLKAALLKSEASFFRNLLPPQQQRLLTAFEEVSAAPGETVIKPGEEAAWIVVVDGSLEADDELATEADPPNPSPRTLRSGDSFGAEEVRRGTTMQHLVKCPSSVSASTIIYKATCKRIAEHLLLQPTSSSIEALLQKNEIQQILQEIFLFKSMPESQLEQVVSALSTKAYKPYDFVFRQGEESDAFYLIKSGTIEVHVTEGLRQEQRTRTVVQKVGTSSAKTIHVVGSGGGGAENNTAKNDKDNQSKGNDQHQDSTAAAATPKSPDVEMKPASPPPQQQEQTGKKKILRTLGVWDYLGERGLLLNESRSASCQAQEEGAECLALDKETFLKIVGNFRKVLEHRMKLQDSNITLADLKPLHIVGKGTFGVVKLCCHREDPSKQYALKCIDKAAAVRLKQQKSLQTEKAINSQCFHPCIVQFIKTLQDRNTIYFLTEFLGGGDLFLGIRAIGMLSREQSRFYAASILLALEYLHERKIIYRDLKPENVLLDFEGRAKLVDFGCCKTAARAYTVVGTPEYLAPEVILGKGYTHVVDFWSLGVVMYEFICGPLPFGVDSGEDQMELFRQILEMPVKFPDYVRDEEAVSMLNHLLEKVPDLRLGTGALREKEIKEHRYLEPPWKPDAASIKNGWTRCDTIVDTEDGDSAMSDVSEIDDGKTTPKKTEDTQTVSANKVVDTSWCAGF
ncbi:unnamed protein product [Amoebophrya sp. A25]|nr:unnamed protein product [Amoebophrya sp. A25]|eukprot:GSA25T00021090001.1